MDGSGAKPRRVFESGSILLYLTEKFGAFLRPIRTSAPRHSTGCSGRWGTPYAGGGFGHFYHYAPVKIDYAINRFAMEVKRQLDTSRTTSIWRATSTRSPIWRSGRWPIRVEKSGWATYLTRNGMRNEA